MWPKTPACAIRAGRAALASNSLVSSTAPITDNALRRTRAAATPATLDTYAANSFAHLFPIVIIEARVWLPINASAIRAGPGMTARVLCARMVARTMVRVLGRINVCARRNGREKHAIGQSARLTATNEAFASRRMFASVQLNIRASTARSVLIIRGLMERIVFYARDV